MWIRELNPVPCFSLLVFRPRPTAAIPPSDVFRHNTGTQKKTPYGYDEGKVSFEPYFAADSEKAEIGFEPMNNGFAIRPLSPLGYSA